MPSEQKKSVSTLTNDETKVLRSGLKLKSMNAEINSWCFQTVRKAERRGEGQVEREKERRRSMMNKDVEQKGKYEY